MIAGQRETIRAGLALDSTMDGLYSNNDPINDIKPTLPAPVAAAQPLQPQPQLPGSMQPQFQQPQMAFRPRPQYQLPYQPQQQFQQPQYFIQAMPAAPINFYGCDQLGHMAREYPQQRQAGYQQEPPASRGGFTGNDRNSRYSYRGRGQPTCYRCLQQGHLIRDCQTSEQQVDSLRKQNLEKYYPKPQGNKATVQAAQESNPGQPAAADLAGNRPGRCVLNSLNLCATKAAASAEACRYLNAIFRDSAKNLIRQYGLVDTGNTVPG